jgi:U1 small nuclear ribonucleoprotein C
MASLLQPFSQPVLSSHAASSSSSSSSASSSTSNFHGTAGSDLPPQMGFTVPAHQFEAYQEFLAARLARRHFEDGDELAASDPDLSASGPSSSAAASLHEDAAADEAAPPKPPASAMEREPPSKRPPSNQTKTVPFKAVVDGITALDPNFRGCLTDFFLSSEEVRKAETLAPSLPSRLNMGMRMTVGPESLREVVALITTSLRYTLHNIQMLRESDSAAVDDALASLRLQMAAATKLQETIMAEAFKINPQSTRAFLVKDQLPRTIAPFLQKFFRAGAGGELPLSGADQPPADLLGFDSLPVDSASTTRLPPGYTILVAPPTSAGGGQQTGGAEFQSQQQQQQQQQSIASSAGPHLTFPQQQPFQQFAAPPFTSTFPGAPPAQFPEGVPGFPFQAPPSPRMFPFPAPVPPGVFPPPYPYPGGPPQWPSGSYAADSSGYGYSYGAPGYYPPGSGHSYGPPYQPAPGRGRRGGAAGPPRPKK